MLAGIRAAIFDEIDAVERMKERARTLFNRNGVLFREILERECEGWRWRGAFRALFAVEVNPKRAKIRRK